MFMVIYADLGECMMERRNGGKIRVKRMRAVVSLGLAVIEKSLRLSRPVGTVAV